MTPPQFPGGVEALLTVKQVAASLQVSVRSVRRFIAENRLRVVHIGRALRGRTRLPRLQPSPA